MKAIYHLENVWGSRVTAPLSVRIVEIEPMQVVSTDTTTGPAWPFADHK